MLKKTSAVETEQEKFLQSSRYAKLPDEEKEARKKEHIVDEAQQEEKEGTALSDVSLSGETVDALEEIKRMVEVLQSIQSIGKDQASLDRVGRGMSGSDVIIAPNILEQMATDSEKAAYYENKIDNYFNTVIPRDTFVFASKGLVYEPGGVVVHEDGTVTYISGCSDSPERVAEVEEARRKAEEEEAKMRKESLERSREAAEEQKQVREHFVFFSRLRSLSKSY